MPASALAAYKLESGSSSVTRHRAHCLSQNADQDGCSRTKPAIRAASSGQGRLAAGACPALYWDLGQDAGCGAGTGHRAGASATTTRLSCSASTSASFSSRSWRTAACSGRAVRACSSWRR
jgi:hypothetical protein